MDRFEKPQITQYIPEGQKGLARIVHYEVSESESLMTRIRSARHPINRWDYVPAGRYARLEVGGNLMMSDTRMEWATNGNVISKATGDLLIAGLGIGLILIPILAREAVRSVTVIEKYQDVIDLVLPNLANVAGHEKLHVICADVFEWKPPPAQAFETIYFDIWPEVCGRNLKEMTTLKRRFARRLRRNIKGAWMGCWRETDLRYQRKLGF